MAAWRSKQHGMVWREKAWAAAAASAAMAAWQRRLKKSKYHVAWQRNISGIKRHRQQ